jgi:chorismate synthase
MLNSFGNLLKITSFGESHGAGVGVVIDGFPAGIEVDEKFLQFELDRRKPGQSKITTQRKESDAFEILSGVFEGKSTGAPIAILIRNSDAKSKDYDHIKDVFRPSHADFTYQEKYGNRDYRGGGRSSARITAGWVVAGALAKLLIQQKNVACHAYVSQVGDFILDKSYQELDLSKIDSNEVRCPDSEAASKMFELIDAIRKNKDTVGGVITGVIKGMPVGLGEPLFGKLNAALGNAMLSINAVKGFELGSGFDGVKMKGSEHNDQIEVIDGNPKTITNYSGGIQGGISNGEDIYFRVAFKPVATIMQDQQSINKEGKVATVKGRGRHDPCVVPRAVPIVEAMSALVVADFYLLAQTNILRG